MSLLNAEQSDQPKSSRNIAVIGSTGRTGRLVLNEGVLRGHSMTAFTRRPDTLAEVNGLKSVVRGDGRNLEDMRRAMRQCERLGDRRSAALDRDQSRPLDSAKALCRLCADGAAH